MSEIYLSNYSSDELNNGTVLPIDMQFNSGHLLAICVYSILMCFSAVANITVLSAILRLRWKQRRLNTVQLLLFNLAVADLLVTFLMMPLEIAWSATVSWQGGDLLCRFCSFFRIFGLYLSGFVLICISVDRYYAILHPLKSLPDQSHHRARLMLTAAWMSSALCSLPQVLIFHVETHPLYTSYRQCVTFNSFPNLGYETAYNVFVFGFLYGVPLVTILVCYVRILWEINRINKAQRYSNANDDQGNHLRISNTGAMCRAKIRTLKMTVAIVTTFFFCWTPYQIMCLWYWMDHKSASEVDQRVQKMLFLFACTNSCMNPVIYGLFHFRPRRGQVNNNASMMTTMTMTSHHNHHRHSGDNINTPLQKQ